MVAAQNQLLAGEPGLLGQPGYVCREVGRGLAGIAATVVDLITGGFNKHRRVRVAAVGKGGGQHDGVGRADAGDANQVAGLVLINDCRQRRHGS